MDLIFRFSTMSDINIFPIVYKSWTEGQMKQKVILVVRLNVYMSKLKFI